MSDSAREAAWRKYADQIDVDYTAPTVRDDFDAGWNAAKAGAPATAKRCFFPESCCCQRKAEAPKSHASAPWPLLTGDAEADEDAIINFVKYVYGAGAKGRPVTKADIADFRVKLAKQR